jgi:hypothetical protein
MRRLAAFLFCAVSTLKVITDPYSGLNYDEINVYDYTQEYLEDCIHVTEGEGGYEEEAEETEDVVEEETEEVVVDELYFLKPSPNAWWK